MKNRDKYFVFNKESDFTAGFLRNIAYTKAGIRIEDNSSDVSALFYSKLLDSREKETLWHRIIIDSESLGDASIRFTFYSGEERSLKYADRIYDTAEFIRDESIPADEKEKAFERFRVKGALNPRDMLLSEASGRYLWFKIELFGQGDESPAISKIKIYIKNQAWIEYLPEIYQSDGKGRSFTERFLSIFQSIYDDMDEKLNSIAGYFDPDVADYEVLRWLSEWIDTDDPYIWSEEKLRYLVLNGIDLYRRRGTRSAISDMVELYTGQKPQIIEHYEIERYRDNDRMSRLLQRLYGDNAYQFTVIVNEECVPTTKEFKTLLRIIESIKPANTEANLVVLKPYIFLNKYSYLGINSVLGQYRPANLDGFSALQFSNVTGNPAE